MPAFPTSYPHLFKNFSRTWGAMLDDRIKNPKLKAVISGLWGYFGLPPSKLSPFYYAMPLMGYLEGGGYYPVGTSQKISDAFVGLIKKNGGEVKLNTRVERILTRDHAAIGVRTADGAEYRGRAVISNANAVDTFTRMMDEKEFLKDLLRAHGKLFRQLFDLSRLAGPQDGPRPQGRAQGERDLLSPGLRHRGRVQGRPGRGPAGRSGVRADRLRQPRPGLSRPKGKNTLNIIACQGYDYWKKYETDYFYGNKDAYTKEKMRLADILIDKVEKMFLPGCARPSRSSRSRRR